MTKTFTVKHGLDSRCCNRNNQWFLGPQDFSVYHCQTCISLDTMSMLSQRSAGVPGEVYIAGAEMVANS